MEEKYKIHAAYILGILLTVIVVLLSVKWADIPNLAQIFSFGLTFASLLLAILAIGYAVYSNSSISQTVSTLNNISRDVFESATNISQTAKDLSMRVEAIPLKLDSVEGKVDQATLLLQQFSGVKDELPPSEREDKAATEIVELFLRRASVAGLLGLQACFISLAKGKPFNIRDLCSRFSIASELYVLGFLTASRGAGLITAKRAGKSYYQWQVTQMNEKLREGILPEFNKRLDKLDDKNKLRIQTDLNQIKLYFESNR